MSHRFWTYGFCVHLSLVAVIAMSAYLGILPTILRAIPHFDLLAHFILVGLLAFFLDGVLKFRPFIPGKIEWLRLAPMMIFCFAAIEEAVQRFSPHRTSSIGDFLANSIGIFVCSWLAKMLTERYNSSERTA